MSMAEILERKRVRNYEPMRLRGGFAILAPAGCILTVFVFTAMAIQDAPQGGIEQRVSDVLSRMTLDEKIGQMSQSTSMATLSAAIKEEIRKGRWGSFLNAGSPGDRAEAQRIARNESRLGIPLR